MEPRRYGSLRITRVAAAAVLATAVHPLTALSETPEQQPLLERPMTPARSTVAVGLALGLILASKEAARLQPSRAERLRARPEA